MADIDDVLIALVAQVGAALYPSGAVNPMAASAIGAGCRIYPGWPISEQLDADIAAGAVNVSVYPRDEERSTTRYLEDWQTISIKPTTVTLVVAGLTVTVGGTAGVGQNVALLVNAKAYAYAVLASDTLASIAAALAALVNVDTPASASGPVITIPGAAQRLVARVGSTGISAKEVGRQEKSVQVTFWCPSPALRTAAVKAVQPALRALRFLTLADGTAARLVYHRNTQTDDSKVGLYRRDLFFTVEYADVLTETDTQVLIEQLNISGGVSPTGAVVPNPPAIATINL